MPRCLVVQRFEDELVVVPLLCAEQVVEVALAMFPFCSLGTLRWTYGLALTEKARTSNQAVLLWVDSAMSRVCKHSSLIEQVDPMLL